MIVRIALHIQSNARKTEVAGWHGDVIQLRVHAPPVDDAASDAVMELLARSFGIPKRQVTLVQGASSRSKLFALEGEDTPALDAWTLGEAGPR